MSYAIIRNQKELTKQAKLIQKAEKYEKEKYRLVLNNDKDKYSCFSKNIS